MTTVTIRTVVRSAPRLAILAAPSVNFAASGAPKMCAFCALSTNSRSITPTVRSWATRLSTWKSAKKNGDWTRIGRQLESGLVPVSL